MVKGKQVGFKPSGRVVVINKNDKRVNCPHEDKILYCVRDGYRYFWCNDCHNLIREPLPKEQKINLFNKLKNKLSGNKNE